MGALCPKDNTDPGDEVRKKGIRKVNRDVLVQELHAREGNHLIETIRATNTEAQINQFLSKGIRLDDIKIICLLGAGAFA